MALSGFLRRVLTVLIISGLFAGNAVYALAASGMQEIGRDAPMRQAPCGQTAAMSGSDAAVSGPRMARNMMPSGCMVLGGIACFQIPALAPTAGGAAGASVGYAPVAYWPCTRMLDGLARKPELLPPIAA